MICPEGTSKSDSLGSRVDRNGCQPALTAMRRLSPALAGAEGRPERSWPASVRALGVAAMALGLAPATAGAQNPFSLRFHGHGVDRIDRVEIGIDAPARPADVGAGDFTIEFWMKAQDADNGAGACEAGQDGWIRGNIVVDRDIFGVADYGDFGIALFDDGIGFGVAAGSGGIGLCGATAVDDGAWHHVAVTRSGGSIALWVDGQLDGTASGGPTGNLSYRNGRSGTVNDPYLVLGAEKHDAGPDYPSYSGLLDELRLSTVVRYTAPFVRPANPFVPDAATAALYHFDEGPAGACTGTVVDSSGAAGGPSHGTCRYGGSSPAGPAYSTDVAPIGAATCSTGPPDAAGACPDASVAGGAADSRRRPLDAAAAASR